MPTVPSPRKALKAAGRVNLLARARKRTAATERTERIHPPNNESGMQSDLIVAERSERLDTLLQRRAPCAAEVSRKQLQRTIKAGSTCVNGTPVQKPSCPVKAGDAVTFAFLASREALSPSPSPPWKEPPAAQNISLEVVYQDDDVLIIDKPAGMVTHPGPGAEEGTLVNACLNITDLCPNPSGEVERPGVVHRLDKGTSGLIALAKTGRAMSSLSEQFRHRVASRKYVSLLSGSVPSDQGELSTHFGRHPGDRTRRAVVSSSASDARIATSFFRVVARVGSPSPAASLVEWSLGSGRTHQIRVHAKYMGYPVLGDDGYGGARRRAIRDLQAAGLKRAVARDCLQSLGRPALHAKELSVVHPTSHKWCRFVAPMPVDMKELALSIDPMCPLD